MLKYIYNMKTVNNISILPFWHTTNGFRPKSSICSINKRKGKIMTNNKFKKVSTSLLCEAGFMLLRDKGKKNIFVSRYTGNYIYTSKTPQCADTEMKKLKSKINRGYN